MTQFFDLKLLKFLVVGGLATAVQFVFLVLFVEVVGLGKVISSAASYIAGAVCNYILNYYLTFKSDRSHWSTLPKFVVVVIFGICVNTGVFAFFVNAVPYIIAQCMAVGAALIANFLLHRYWIYRNNDMSN